jgi:hypothetical protein
MGSLDVDADVVGEEEDRDEDECEEAEAEADEEDDGVNIVGMADMETFFSLFSGLSTLLPWCWCNDDESPLGWCNMLTNGGPLAVVVAFRSGLGVFNAMLGLKSLSTRRKIK